MPNQPNGQSLHRGTQIPPTDGRARQTEGVTRTPRAGNSPAQAAVTVGGACVHTPRCPAADRADGEAAHTVAAHPEQGWSVLCNGIVLFDDTGELLPDGRVIAPHRPTDVHPEVFGICLLA